MWLKITSNFTKNTMMNNEELDIIFKNLSKVIRGAYGNWELEIDSTRFICLTDEYHNRMRIISPITEVSNVDSEQIIKCMEANFHTALDTKYAISNGIVWSVFIHPLKELSQQQVIDAISQVYSSVKTFGSSYSSGNLIFPKSDS